MTSSGQDSPELDDFMPRGVEAGRLQIDHNEPLRVNGRVGDGPSKSRDLTAT
jgi:hypothetical protein